LWIAAALTVALTAPLRADLIGWSYSTSPLSTTLTADSGSGTVTMTGEGPNPVSAAGNSNIVASSITVSSSSTAGLSATAGQYTIQLTLTDSASGLSKTVDFTGALSGTFSAGSANLQNTFNMGKDVFTLGANQYTITFDSYLPPGPTNSGNAGAIGASVQVAAAGGNPITSSVTPEPSSLLLCGFGVAGCALARLRRLVSARSGPGR
jgi:hypothetical protein